MKIGSNMVTADHGPRPAGPPDECFYCSNKIGSAHKPDCVMRERTVVVKFQGEAVIRIPDHWDENMVNFRYNGSSHCTNNLIHWLEEWAEDPTRRDCLCGKLSVMFAREATEKDHEGLPILPIYE